MPALILLLLAVLGLTLAVDLLARSWPLNADSHGHERRPSELHALGRDVSVGNAVWML